MSTKSARDARYEKEAEEMLKAVPENLPVSKKAPKQGVTKLFLQTAIEDLPGEGNVAMNPHQILVQPWAARDASEYTGESFEELKASIKADGGNSQYIDVRRIESPDGHLFELLAGSRRLQACKDLGIKVRTTIRECSDQDADRIHELENQARKNKSVYSQGLRYSQLLQSGRYDDQESLAQALGVAQPNISKAVRLVTAAPPAMWGKVSDPSSLTWRDADVLIEAYKNTGFVAAVKESGQLTAKQLLSLARVRPRRMATTDELALVKVRQGYVIKHPAIKDKSVAERVLAAVKGVLG